VKISISERNGSVHYLLPTVPAPFPRGLHWEALVTESTKRTDPALDEELRKGNTKGSVNGSVKKSGSPLF